MSADPQRPEVDDPRVLALAKARQHIAHSSPFNFVCPPWDGLSEQEQHLSLLDARNYLRAAIVADLIPAAGAVPGRAGDIEREKDTSGGHEPAEGESTPAEPLIVSRYDAALEPAPEEEPVFTVGAIAEDGHPVALFFDPEARRKVAGWLAPGDAAELERLRAFASATERRHDEIRAQLARIDIRDSAEAWDLGMAILAILDWPVHPDSRPVPSLADVFRARIYDALTEAAETGPLSALALAQIRQYLAEVITAGLLRRHGAPCEQVARATDPDGAGQ
ncbi:hypothetical protein [Streptomyces sp. T028]|uniref:hypothetical protein n=1 Tax=Streptomyces sp. T028 TaxID=3394379 RepID=UPI003A8BBB25